MAREVRVYRDGNRIVYDNRKVDEPRTLPGAGPDLRQIHYLAHLGLVPVIRQWRIVAAAKVAEGTQFEFVRPANAEPIPGSYAQATSVVVVFSRAESMPIRIDVFGDTWWRSGAMGYNQC